MFRRISACDFNEKEMKLKRKYLPPVERSLRVYSTTTDNSWCTRPALIPLTMSGVFNVFIKGVDGISRQIFRSHSLPYLPHVHCGQNFHAGSFLGARPGLARKRPVEGEVGAAYHLSPTRLRESRVAVLWHLLVVGIYYGSLRGLSAATCRRGRGLGAHLFP